jgi:hypothetical protein
MRHETRTLLEDRPSEGVIFSFMVIAGLALFFGEITQLFFDSGGHNESAAMRGQVFAFAIGCFLLTPLGVYFISAIATPFLRRFGGAGGHYETRMAVAWSAAVAAPIILLNALVEVGVSHWGLPMSAGFVLHVVLSALWAYFLASAVAAVHGFRSARRVLGPAALIIVALAIAYGMARYATMG